jgi:hypothetical protein
VTEAPAARVLDALPADLGELDYSAVARPFEQMSDI